MRVKDRGQENEGSDLTSNCKDRMRGVNLSDFESHTSHPHFRDDNVILRFTTTRTTPTSRHYSLVYFLTFTSNVKSR